MNPQRVAAEFGSHAALAREGIAAFYQALSSPEYAGIASARRDGNRFSARPPAAIRPRHR